MLKREDILRTIMLLGSGTALLACAAKPSVSAAPSGTTGGGEAAEAGCGAHKGEGGCGAKGGEGGCGAHKGPQSPAAADGGVAPSQGGEAGCGANSCGAK